MNKKLIVSGLNQNSWEVFFVYELKKQMKLDLVYWELPKVTYEIASNLFDKKSLVLDASTKKKRIKGLKKYNWPLLDEIVIKKLSKYELILYPSFLRNTQTRSIRGDFNLKDEYHRAITLRYYFIKYFDPGLYLFGNVPTGFFTLLDYLICNIKNIETILFKRVDLPCFYSTPLRSMEDTIFDDKKNNIELNQRSNSKKIDPEIINYLNSLLKEYRNAIPEYWITDDISNNTFSDRFRIDKKSNKLINKKNFFIELISQTVKQKNILKSVRFFFKSMVYFYFKNKLFKEYNKLVTKNLDLKKKYVFLALSFQPEATSIPLGGIFAYQEFMVSMLSRSIPNDWYIYVKEHPRHLLANESINSLKFRHVNFYNNLTDYRNVKLVSIDHNSFDLIDNAQVVAALAGHVGLESIMRGTPFLSFAFPWYNNCEGVYKIKNIEDLENFFNKKMYQNKINLEDIFDHVGIILKYSIKNFHWMEDKKLSNPKSYGSNIAKKFLKIIT